MSETLGHHEMTVAQHKDKLRGQCAMALDYNAKITLALAHTIRCSPMAGMPPASLSAIEGCRDYMAKLGEWLDKAEESARAIERGEDALNRRGHHEQGEANG